MIGSRQRRFRSEKRLEPDALGSFTATETDCPAARVKRAFPEGPPASLMFMGTSGLPAGRCPIDKGYRSGSAEMPKRRGLQADESLRSAAAGLCLIHSAGGGLPLRIFLCLASRTSKLPAGRLGV